LIETAVIDSGYKFPSRASHTDAATDFRRRHACLYPPSLQLWRGKQLLSSCIVSELWSVNFPAMPAGEQMNPVLFHVEGVWFGSHQRELENGSILSIDAVEITANTAVDRRLQWARAGWNSGIAGDTPATIAEGRGGYRSKGRSGRQRLQRTAHAS